MPKVGATYSNVPPRNWVRKCSSTHIKIRSPNWVRGRNSAQIKIRRTNWVRRRSRQELWGKPALMAGPNRASIRGEE